MAKLLKPSRLDTDPSSSNAAQEWKHWHRTFTNFIGESGEAAPDKNVLATRRQQSGESIDEFLRELHKLSKDCNFQPVTAEQYRQELVRDAFINGIASVFIRQQLLENKSLNLKTAHSQAPTNISVNGHSLKALVDSCSSDSFICEEEVAQRLKRTVVPASSAVSMASKSFNASSPGFVIADLVHLDQRYPCIQLGVLKDLCCDVILDYDFQKQHQSMSFQYEGKRQSLKITGAKPVCLLATADIDEPSLFPNLPQQCKPIAVKSRRYSQDDQLFVKDQISHLLSEGIIEPSISPWRAQVVVVKDPLDRHKKRLCIDYSQTINQYT
ncbi:uncharacterized protein [Palaemon carinicauda]|uniref:uncharacterized protein n=1 Tax=Palaemon carinicauda TaxID=392227 RepID=UPI0035B68ECC